MKSSLSQRIFRDTGDVLIVSCRNGMLRLADLPLWLAANGHEGYELLTTSKARELILAREEKITTCFPIIAISDDGERAEILCTQGMVSFMRDLNAIPCGETTAIYAILKKKS